MVLYLVVEKYVLKIFFRGIAINNPKNNRIFAVVTIKTFKQ